MPVKAQVPPKGVLRFDTLLEKLGVNHVDSSAKACYRKVVTLFL